MGCVMKKSSVLASLVLLLTGCSGASIDDYAGREPHMDVREYFNGKVVAKGVFRNWRGVVEDQFVVQMHGKFDDKGGTMKEVFTYADGHTAERVWTIVMKDESHFTGTTHDVVGEATGEQKGNAMHMRYVLRVPYKGSTIDLSMDDWIYRIDKTTVINHIDMRKFGFSVGELILTFEKKN